MAEQQSSMVTESRRNTELKLSALLSLNRTHVTEALTILVSALYESEIEHPIEDLDVSSIAVLDLSEAVESAFVAHGA